MYVYIEQSLLVPISQKCVQYSPVWFQYRRYQNIRRREQYKILLTSQRTDTSSITIWLFLSGKINSLLGTYYRISILYFRVGFIVLLWTSVCFWISDIVRSAHLPIVSYRKPVGTWESGCLLTESGCLVYVWPDVIRVRGGWFDG